MTNIRDLFRDQTGGINYVNVILLLILAAIIVVVYIYGGGTYKSFKLGHFAEGQIVKATIQSDTEIYNNVREEAERLGIDMSTFEVIVSRNTAEKKMEISFTFQQPIPFSEKHKPYHKSILKEYQDIQYLEHNANTKKYE